MIEELEERLNNIKPVIDLSKEPMLVGKDKLYSASQCIESFVGFHSYMLIQVIDRDIYTDFFSTHDEAYKRMLEDMEEILGVSPEITDESVNKVAESWDYDYEYSSAWLSGKNNYDWKIVNVI